MTTSQYELLKKINLDDLASSFGWEGRPFPSRLLQKVFMKPAELFAQQMTDFDVAVGQSGLVEGSRLALRKYFRDVRVFGSDLIPESGFLALSNHPGMADSISTFASLGRPDLKIIASQRPFLEALSNLSKQLIFVTPDAATRITLVRQVSTHLKNGGAALTYPAGHIEPDPDIHTDAIDSLKTWTDSVGIFIRLTPDTPILPILVRGVVWDKATFHPLTYIKRTREEREKLGAALQIFAHMMWEVEAVKIRVQIGTPIYVKDLGSNDTHVIHQAVLREMERLIKDPPQGGGKMIL